MNCSMSVTIVQLIFTFQFVTTAQKSWTNDFADRQIIFENRTGSMNDLLKEDPDTFANDLDTLESKRPDLIYIAMKCIYADMVVDVLHRIYSHISDYLDDTDAQDPVRNVKELINNHFFKMKPIFEKMLYNLFYYLDKHRQLWTTDQSLLKSVLSIHAFLNYGQKNDPFKRRTKVALPDGNGWRYVQYDLSDGETLDVIRIFNNSVVEMIGLIEIFRCKNCIVGNIFRFLKDLKFDLPPMSFIESKTDSLVTLINNGPVTHDHRNNYNAGMYDTDTLLMGHLLRLHESIMSDAIIALGNGRYIRFKIFYEIVRNTYQLEHVLKYHNYLYEIIGNIFAVQIYNLLCNNDNITELESLVKNLNTFVDEILPNKYWSNVCGYLIEIKNVLKFCLVDYDRKIYCTDEEINKIIRKLITLFHQHFWHTDEAFSIVKKLPLQSLVYSILNNKMFMSFRQVVTLLSFESNMNRHHHILNVNEMPINVTESDGHLRSKYMAKIRFVLFRFWLLLLNWNNKPNEGNYNGDDKPTNDDLKNSFFLTTRYLKDQYKKLKHSSYIRKLFIPVLLHFAYVEESFKNLTHFDFIKLELMLTFTISAMEKFCFQAYKWPIRNVDIVNHSAMFLDGNSVSYENLVKSYVPIHEFENKFFLFFMKNTVIFHEQYLLNFDDEIEFYWNGISTSFFNIITVLSRSIIDYQGLIWYRLIIVKWFLAKLLLKLKYVLTHSKDILKMEQEGLPIRHDLMDLVRLFKQLKLLKNANIYVTLLFEMAKSTMKDTTSVFEDDIIHIITSMIDAILVSLGTATKQLTFERTDEVVLNLQYDKSNLENFLSQINDENEKFLNFNIGSLGFSTLFLPI